MSYCEHANSEHKKKRRDFLLASLVVMQDYVIGEEAMVTAQPNSLCGQLYPASGWEGHNYLIEKLVLVNV
jgi:hypothetical protein